jgi:hypothetical protein
MDDPLFVRGLERLRNLPRDGQGLVARRLHSEVFVTRVEIAVG